MCLIGPGPPSKIMANRRIAEIPGAHMPVMSCAKDVVSKLDSAGSDQETMAKLLRIPHSLASVGHHSYKHTSTGRVVGNGTHSQGQL